MGFHDIGRLNQALLGKQASHIWSQPDSLVARVLEGKYFNKCGFLECGRYSTKSGYRLLESIINTQQPQHVTLPPIEKQLWKNIWKVKAPPKIKHFLWRALSGALAVKERLQTRGIQLDTACQQCGRGVESICHVLFTCIKQQRYGRARTYSYLQQVSPEHRIP